MSASSPGGSAEAGSAEAGSAEAGSAEPGSAEAGSAEPGQPSVLVVDDRLNMRRLLQKVLGGIARVSVAASGEQALLALSQAPYSVIVCDLKMPGLDGLHVLKESRRLQPNSEFILMTAYGSVGKAVEAMRLGAYDYVSKPFDPDEVRTLVSRALGGSAVAIRTTPSQGSADQSPAFTEILPGLFGACEEMHALGAIVRKFGPSDATTLVLGETGTGKELVARALHNLSPRQGKNMVAVNCAAIPSALLESELFGHVKGAFTGATTDRAGLFEQADGGTLLLDEIGELKLSLQAKLTRVLEERTIRKVGGVLELPVDVRIIAATHRDVQAMVSEGAFRQDLWYRLNVMSVSLPSLRSRGEDRMMLAEHFLRQRVRASNRRLSGFSQGATDALCAYAWPGNIRQLKAAVERASVVGEGPEIQVSDLPPEIAASLGADAGSAQEASLPEAALKELSWQGALDLSRDAVAPRYLSAILRKARGNVARAAAQAEVERESFYRLLRRHGVKPSDFR